MGECPEGRYPAEVRGPMRTEYSTCVADIYFPAGQSKLRLMDSALPRNDGFLEYFFCGMTKESAK